MPPVEHRFTGPSYTLGVEEELMIIDAETLDLANSIEGLLDGLAETSAEGEVKPELMESVCEIATTPCENTREVALQLKALRSTVMQVAQERGLAIGSAGTHPFAMWEDQRIVSRPRYRDLVAGLQFVARQELIFGIHVHVGLDDPDKAIHVVNGMRVHLPLLLALSANSPFWRADSTGLLSTRTPIFRAFPRVGIPPRYDDFEDWSKRIKFMIESKVIADYTYLWYDVRPHPNFGTVEVRVMDSQTRVEHTVALAAMVQAMVKELAEHHEAGQARCRATPTRCSTRTSGSPPGTGSTASSWTCPSRTGCARRTSCAGCSSGFTRTPRSSAPPRTSTGSRTCSTTATGPPASRSSTRPTTTSARSSPRSSPPRCRLSRPRPDQR